jgi:hypothetical protein
MSEEIDIEEEKEKMKGWSERDVLEWLLEEREEDPSKAFGMEPEGQKQESDIISAKMLRDLAQAGHLPEVLRMLGLTENEITEITIRHGKIPANVVTNIGLMDAMGQQTEAANRKLYENNEIDLAQYIRNQSASDFAKIHTKSVVNALSAVDGHRFEGLQKNIMSGKMAHETLQSDAEKKKMGRVAKLKAWMSGDRDV